MGQTVSTTANGRLLPMQTTTGESSGAQADADNAGFYVHRLTTIPSGELFRIPARSLHHAGLVSGDDASEVYLLECATFQPIMTGPSASQHVPLTDELLSIFSVDALKQILNDIERPRQRISGIRKERLLERVKRIMRTQLVYLQIRPDGSRVEGENPVVRGEAEVDEPFPPLPMTRSDIERVINAVAPLYRDEEVMESGCAVCGQATRTRELIPLQALTESDLELLTQDLSKVDDCTRIIRHSTTEPIRGIPGPVLDPECHGFCGRCKTELRSGRTPLYNLANGRWLGTIPPELKGLTLFEERIIARVHRSIYVVKVRESNRHKLVGNVVSYPSPTPRIYSVLPPPRADAEEMLAYIYMGPKAPTDNLTRRMPMFVRRNKLRGALDCLKLNHADYQDIEISEEHLLQYSDEPEGEIPVKVLYHYENKEHTRDQESTAVYDHDPEGNTSGNMDCLYSVTALVPDANGAEPDEPARLAQAVQKLRDGQPVIGVGRGALPVRFFDDPQYLPATFPTLFSYGMGGIKNTRGVHARKPVSSDVWIRMLLLHWDKRFQRHEDFMLSVFSNQQFRQSSLSTHLQTKKAHFAEVIELLTRLRVEAVEEVIQDYERGTKPDTTRAEITDVLQALKKVELVTRSVYGSVSSSVTVMRPLLPINSFTCSLFVSTAH